MNRNPAVAGQFYAASKRQLEDDITACFEHRLGPGAAAKEIQPEPIVAAVVPHAGYVYSGMVAAHVYQKIAAQAETDVFIILGPNHRGMGKTVSLYPQGRWDTPLGTVAVDNIMAERLLTTPAIHADKDAHTYEHSIEVQLPFLQTVAKGFTFVPIALMDQSATTAKTVGEALAAAIAQESRRVTLLASSDFSHYVTAEQASRDDGEAIEKIISLQTDQFYQYVISKQISICGYGPIMAIMTAASILGVKKGELLKYATSGDVHPMPEVVGYAAITF